MRREFLFLTLLIPSILFSHGGGLNKDGCHNDRKTGGYHCHRSPTVTPNFSQPAQRPSSEKDIARIWCSAREGTNEFRTQYGTYVDCLTAKYAVEVEYDNNWKEAIGQSLHYAEATGKSPAILLVKRKSSNKNYYQELSKVITQYQLPIKVYQIQE